MRYKPLLNPETGRWDCVSYLPGKLGWLASIGDSFTQQGAQDMADKANAVPQPLPWVEPAERKFARTQAMQDELF